MFLNPIDQSVTQPIRKCILFVTWKIPFNLISTQSNSEKAVRNIYGIADMCSETSAHVHGVIGDLVRTHAD